MIGLLLLEMNFSLQYMLETGKIFVVDLPISFLQGKRYRQRWKGQL